MLKSAKLVDDEADDVQVVMVSVDPQRDTPAVVSEYVDQFHPSFIGLSGTAADIASDLRFLLQE